MITLRQQSEAFAAALPERLPGWESPVAFVQLGSGFDPAGLFDEELGAVALDSFPGMPSAASPAGHPLRLVLGRCGRRQVLLAHGRRHLYEGYGVHPCVLPVCGAALAGLRRQVYLCAAGSLRSEFKPGMIVAITDCINQLGCSPLVGAAPLGRHYFQPLNEAFSQAMISSFINFRLPGEPVVRLGVYQANLGPQYETPAEVEVARRNGADLVGMSIVLEAIAAAALECQVLALAAITNHAASHGGRPPGHGEVAETAADLSPGLMRALHRFLAD